MTDPFPNTSDLTTEQRFKVLFGGLSTILVVPIDPINKKNGQIWVNTTSKQLKIYNEGITWTIGSISAES